MNSKLILLVIGCYLLTTGSAEQESRPTINDFTWLAGCWERSDTSRQFVEHWMKPSGGMMIGISHTVVRDKTREYEFLRILEQDNGDIYYIALPSGQKEAAFKLTTYNEKEAVFENPEHDFPQRIIYRLENDSSLVARIEGTSKGKERGVDFPMKRVKCD